MICFPSDFSVEKLIENWDEYTSPARFAGSDDTMDLIFVSKRNKNKVKLVRRARFAREPFSTVFRGKIKKTKSGSEIVGVFTKTILDYVISAAVLALLFYIRAIIIERGGHLNTINVLLAVSIIAFLLLLMNTRGSKRHYSDFICRITGIDVNYFLSKKEQSEIEEENEIPNNKDQ
jgi:hypothetical protein